MIKSLSKLTLLVL